jgi:hypothetical protein
MAWREQFRNRHNQLDSDENPFAIRLRTGPEQVDEVPVELASAREGCRARY